LIPALLDAWQGGLAALQVTAGLLEGLTGWVGHDQPVPTETLPGYSLDWIGEVPGEDALQPGGLGEVSLRLSARLYVASLTKADGAPARALRDWYWRVEGSTHLGLRPALREVLRLRVQGVTFMLVPGDVRTLSKSSDSRWTSALEAQVVARALVAR
jgi:hypothetical protein